jgi:hypothetical protein
MTRGLVLSMFLTAQATPGTTDGLHELMARPLGAGLLRLLVDAEGGGHLFVETPGETSRTVPCDRLPGAWGLWVGDVDDDGAPEAIVAVGKDQPLDPLAGDRLHVYHLVDGQCVPAWRGSRLGGRFERLSPRGSHLLALERLPGGRLRIARYRWQRFNYRVEQILWQGRHPPDPRWLFELDRTER